VAEGQVDLVCGDFRLGRLPLPLHAGLFTIFAMPLLLTRDMVASLLTMAECIEAVQKAFAELAAGTAVLPLRTSLPTPGGISLYMPAYLRDGQALACKVVAVFKDNPQKHRLPTTTGTVLLQDPETGRVCCIMDGEYLTAMRTGAASGVATRLLARREGGQTAGIFGAGVQARMQLLAVAEVRRLSRAWVYDPDAGAAAAFAREMSQRLGLEVAAAADPGEAARADILCTATTSPRPVFAAREVREGAHVNAVGSHTPEARELEGELIRRARLVGDSREACLRESGDIILPLREGLIGEEHFQAELGEIVIGRKPGRLSEREITVFKSNGLAIQDAAAAGLVYRKALEAGVGVAFEL
jgi:ornithine cyclodeaminase/alanine dehydrogenase